MTERYGDYSAIRWLGRGWETFRANPKPLVGGFAIFAGAQLLFMLVGWWRLGALPIPLLVAWEDIAYRVTARIFFAWGPAIVLPLSLGGIVGLIFGPPIALGWLMLCCRANRRASIVATDVFRGLVSWWPAAIGNIRYGLWIIFLGGGIAIGLGFLSLIGFASLRLLQRTDIVPGGISWDSIRDAVGRLVELIADKYPAEPIVWAIRVGFAIIFLLPAAYVAVTYSLWAFAVGDRRLPVRKAFVFSRNATAGYRGSIFVLALVAFVLAAASVFTAGLAMLIFGPWIGASFAAAYDDLARPWPATTP